MSMHGPGPSRGRGFSLIELMVVVAIAATLLVIAVPSFAEVNIRNRIAGEANDFIAGVSYARTEAVRLGATSGICASADGTTCAGDWSEGWLIWSDANRDGAMSASEVLRIGEINALDTFEATGLVAAEVEFTPRGLVDEDSLNPNEDGEFVLRPAECATGKMHQRTLTLTLTGQVRMERESC